MLATIDAVADQLVDERGLVHRYRTGTTADGLTGSEGAFLLCTFWLARARALAGQVDTARQVFLRAASCANDLGLLTEQVDPTSGQPLGNFPQAFSHIGLINAAYTIAEAEKGTYGRGAATRPVRADAHRRGRHVIDQVRNILARRRS
jgi:GH15 family glucan-1,4-alpha-glucosidase